MGGLQLLGEGAPDAFFAGAVLFREGLHEGADAGALVEVGIVGVCAGPDIVDDLVAGVELGIARVVETAHEVEGLGLVRRTPADGGHQLLKGLERECADLDLAVALDAFELLAKIGQGGGHDDADDRHVRCAKLGNEAHGRIAFDKKLEESLFAADDAVKNFVIVAEPCGDLLIGLHHVFFQLLQGLSCRENVIVGFAFGDGGQKATAGFIDANGSGE